jgi:hypothetical protein
VTYDEIIRALDKRSASARRGLECAVEEEKTALFEGTSKYKLRDFGRAALAAAREFYAEDITEQLNNPLPLDPYRLLSHRRLAVAWAVAQILKVDFDTEADRVARQSGGREDFHSDG